MTNQRRMEIWLYLWGEVEQAGGAAVCTGDASPGSRRGGFSIPNSLLIHAQVDRELDKLGPFAKAIARRFFVDGWEWEECMGEDVMIDSFGKRHVSAVPTGKFFRKMTHKLGRGQLCAVNDIVTMLAEIVFKDEAAA